mgnify:CR=1 FL=1
MGRNAWAGVIRKVAIPSPEIPAKIFWINLAAQLCDKSFKPHLECGGSIFGGFIQTVQMLQTNQRGTRIESVVAEKADEYEYQRAVGLVMMAYV